MSVTVMLAVNNEQGEPAHHLGGIILGEAELDPPGRVRYAIGKGFIRIHGHKFKIGRHREWVGNWCWDSVAMRAPEALRLARLLRRKAWACTSAPVRVSAWFEKVPA